MTCVVRAIVRSWLCESDREVALILVNLSLNHQHQIDVVSQYFNQYILQVNF